MDAKIEQLLLWCIHIAHINILLPECFEQYTLLGGKAVQNIAKYLLFSMNGATR